MYIVGTGRSVLRWSFFLLLSLLIWSLHTSAISAQTQTSNRAGLSISPALYEEQHEPGTVHTFTIRINNLEDRDRSLFLEARDISGVEAGGVPRFATGDEEVTGFELSSWIQFSEDSFDIEANGTKNLDVTINIPDDAPPGSHFGGINVSSQGEQMRRTGAGINFGVTNIVTVLVSGDADERAMIRAFSTDQYVYGSTNVEFTARIENVGNVLQRPVGPLEVTNMFGAEVAQLTVNDSRAGVFPRTERVFTVNWTDENPGFGRYQAVLSMVYGSQGSNQTMTNTVSFWILPMNIIGPAVLVLVAVLLVTFIGVRLYIRRTLRYHTGSSTRIVRNSQRPTPFPFWLLTLIIMLAVTALFLLILLAIFA